MSTEFLTGEALTARIREVMKGNKPRMCVAFLGPDWLDELFEGSVPDGLRVVCDLRMGMTTRYALEAGGAPENDRLRHLPDSEMHAKVYLSEDGAVVCSANASTSALSCQARIEDGVWVGPQTRTFKQIKKEFKKRYKLAVPFDAAALEVAPKRVSGAGEKSRLPDGLTLVEALKRDPDAFQGIRFVCTSTTVSKPVRDAANKELDREAADELVAEDKGSREFFSGWDMSEGDWPALFFALHRGPRGGVHLTKHRHYRFLPSGTGEITEDVIVSHQVDWTTIGAAFGDVPRLASQKRCRKELTNLFRPEGSFDAFAGEVLTGRKFAELLSQSRSNSK